MTRFALAIAGGLLLSGSAHAAYTITVSPITPVHNTQFDGFETNQNVNDGFTSTSFVTQGNTWNLMDSAVIGAGEDVVSQYVAPDELNTYLASYGGVVAHLGQMYTGISFEWGTPGPGGPGAHDTDVLVLGNTIIESPAIRALSDTTQRGAFVTITGLDPFNIAEFNTLWISNGQVYPAKSFEFADVNFTGGSLPATPETSTWAMLLMGFVGLGYAGYRKAHTPRLATI